MVHFSDIEINKFQLNSLLNQHEKKGFKFLLRNEICCSSCKNKDSQLINKHTLYLDRFNDLKITGVCSNCGSSINYIIPFGHSETFFRKAIQFRHKQLETVDN